MTDNLIVVHQKLPDWLVKMIFRQEVETAIKSGLNLGLVSRVFYHMYILGLWFLFNSSFIYKLINIGHVETSWKLIFSSAKRGK